MVTDILHFLGSTIAEASLIPEAPTHILFSPPNTFMKWPQQKNKQNYHLIFVGYF